MKQNDQHLWTRYRVITASLTIARVRHSCGHLARCSGDGVLTGHPARVLSQERLLKSLPCRKCALIPCPRKRGAA